LLEAPDIHSGSIEYASRFSGLVGAWMLDVQWHAINKLIALTVPPPGPVLDIGGGHGQLAMRLAKAGYDVTVLVSNFSAWENLRQEINGLESEADKLASERLTIVEGLIHRPSELFSPDSYPLVLAVRILSHLEQWETFLKEMCLVARKQVVFDYPSNMSINLLKEMLFTMKKRVEGNTRSFLVFDDNEIEKAIKSSNYTIAKKYRQFFLPMALHRFIQVSEVSKTLEKIAHSVGITPLFGSPVVLSAVAS
jgi:2-polyprenyl-3-methyl-5-hydroxy-6-metoxy-1,4-benzoquinol methylase